MKAIVLPRAKGKTTRMIGWMLGGPQRVLVVFSARERDRLRKLVDPHTVIGADLSRRIVCASEVLEGRTRGMWREPVYGVDEVDIVLSFLLRGPVEAISFTGEVES